MANTQNPPPTRTTPRLLDLFPTQVARDSAALGMVSSAARNEQVVSLAHLRNVQTPDHHTELALSINPADLKEFTKHLSMSDVGNNQTRLMIPKDYVVKHILGYLTEEERILVEDENNQGLRISVYDNDTKSSHQLSLKRWVSSGSYVFINNWNKEFVKRRELRVGDRVGLFWNTYSSRLHFRVVTRVNH